jgi:CHAT domain-containing protein
MQKFYRLREAQPGTLKAEALRQAQLALLRGEDKPVGNAARSHNASEKTPPGLTIRSSTADLFW